MIFTTPFPIHTTGDISAEKQQTQCSLMSHFFHPLPPSLENSTVTPNSTRTNVFLQFHKIHCSTYAATVAYNFRDSNMVHYQLATALDSSVMTVHITCIVLMHTGAYLSSRV